MPLNRWVRFLLACSLAATLFAGAAQALAQAGDVTRGLYLSKAAGCAGCHTDIKRAVKEAKGNRL